MALQEEYEYSPFRCAFCGAYNPAKKQRPQAPKLPFEIAQLEKMKEQHGSSSSLAESEGSSSEGSPSGEGEAECKYLRFIQVFVFHFQSDSV